ncbi:MAG: OmpA family protein [Hyphomonadaceae bacterium]|nr:OmpA family protein [Hyphomonadaceae bacterium]
MRLALIAAAILMFSAAPAFAQQSEMDAAERALRTEMAPAGVAVDRVSPNEIRVTMPSDITFDFNRADVRSEFAPRVAGLARTLNQHGGMRIEIIGHADAIGSDQYNQDLSERRARAVGSQLMDYGVGFSRINASGRGEWSPVAPNDTEYGRAQNRRVEIRITNGGGGK